jgi:hypothetical protein
MKLKNRILWRTLKLSPDGKGFVYDSFGKPLFRALECLRVITGLIQIMARRFPRAWAWFPKSKQDAVDAIIGTPNA